MPLMDTKELLAQYPWLKRKVPCEPSQPDDLDIEVICINGLLSINGQGHLPHETCRGTGEQYRWDTFWERCSWMGPADDHFECPRVKASDLTLHHLCDGSGYVLVVDTDKALDALEEVGRPVLHKVRDFEYMVIVYCPPREQTTYTGKGTTRLHAALDALGKIDEEASHES